MRNRSLRAGFKAAAFFAAISPVHLLAQTPDAFGVAGPDNILKGYADAYNQWIDVLGAYGVDLFILLATIDLAWTAISLALEKQELQGWVAGIIRKLMIIAFFYTLLTHGREWTNDIVNSFMQLGAAGSGGQVTATTKPSDIMRMGIDIGGRLLQGAAGVKPGVFNLLTNPLGSLAPALILVVTAFLSVFAFLIPTVHFIMALVESYLVLGAGYIFLGFGGSRWTVPFTEKYLSLVVSVGARLMVLFLVIGLGFNFAKLWAAQADQAAKIGGVGLTATGGVKGTEACFVLVGEVLLYGLICWILPQLAANVIGGTLSASAGDAIGGAVAAGTAAAAATQAVAAVAAAAATGGAAAPVAAADVAATSAASQVSNAAGGAGGLGNGGGGGGGLGDVGPPTGGGQGGPEGLGGSGGLGAGVPPPADFATLGSGTDAGGSEGSSSPGGGSDGFKSSSNGGGQASSSRAATQAQQRVQDANVAGEAAQAEALASGATADEASAAYDAAWSQVLHVGNNGAGSGAPSIAEAGADAVAAADGDRELENDAARGDADLETSAASATPTEGGGAGSGDGSAAANPTGSQGAVFETGNGIDAPAIESAAGKTGEDLKAPQNRAGVSPSEIVEGSDKSGPAVARGGEASATPFETGKGLEATGPEAVPVPSGRDLDAPVSTSGSASSTSAGTESKPGDGARRVGKLAREARSLAQQVHGSLPEDGSTISGATPRVDHGE